jgi:hypothetical protein
MFTKMSFRKVAAVVASLAISIVGLSLSASPASAVTVGFDGWPKHYEVGTPIDVDMSCKPSYDGEVVGESSYVIGNTLPDGLTIDSNWHLVGTPTTVQQVDVGFVRCYSGSDTPSNWMNYYFGVVNIIPASTKAPYVTITNLNDANCDVRVVGSMPTLPDPNSAKLLLSAGTSLVSASLADVQAGELVDLTFSAKDVSALVSDPKVTGFLDIAGGSMDMCNSEMTATLAYQHGGAPAATASATSTPTIAPVIPTDPTVSWEALGDSSCTVRMTAVWPSLQVGATPHLYLATSTFGFDIWLSGVQENTIIQRDFPIMDLTAFADGSVPGIDHYTTWGDAPVCDATPWQALTDVNDASGKLVGSISNGSLRPSLPPTPPTLCTLGTYSETGTAPCVPAEPGYYVDQVGATNQTPCNIGFFSNSAGSPFCAPAPKGSYVGATGSISARACPVGQTTALLAARSAYECYTQSTQTARGVRVLTVYKSSLKFTTVKTTDLGAPLTLTASGACTVSSVKVINKLNGKKVKVDRYQVALGKTGKCTLTYSNAGTEKFKPITIVKKFKITKTGK